MRSEKEMFELILRVAQANERIRAVYMNGSRTNPLVEKDIYQDYDIVFVVSETRSFLSDKAWINIFGEVAIMQEPDSNDFGWGGDCDFTKSYGWLILFKDGNRIDLRQMYDGCCNEFWWCLNNVAKGIKRDQIPYSMRMYTEVVHTQLDRMVEWHIAMNHGFSVSTGMWGKYYKKYMSSELYENYLNTYTDGSPENLWNAVFSACDLFRFLAQQVSDHLGFTYCMQDDENMIKYITSIKDAVY